jgi:hypothetical protein
MAQVAQCLLVRPRVQSPVPLCYASNSHTSVFTDSLDFIRRPCHALFDKVYMTLIQWWNGLMMHFSEQSLSLGFVWLFWNICTWNFTMSEICFKIFSYQPGISGSCLCNPSYSGSRDQEDSGSIPAKIVHGTLSWKNSSQKGLVEWLKV